MYELIQHQKLESTASAITFTNIPQTYSDLYVSVSIRSTNGDDGLFFKFNNTTSNTSWRNILGYGTGTLSQAGGGWLAAGGVRSVTSNTFTNITINVPNYGSNLPKLASVDSTSEETGSNGYQFLLANLWNDTAAVNRIDLYLQTAQLAAGSSATLYGVNRTSGRGRPKAIGGNITYSNGYWVHTFTGSNTFSANEALNIDALVVAGGGGSGFHIPGGGGAGGLLAVQASVQRGAYPILVGSGGPAGATEGSPQGTQGGSSSAFSFTAIGGGYGGTRQLNPASGGAGGSGGGGGGGGNGNPVTGGAGTSGQGNSGGNGYNYPDGRAAGGGGGGAAAAGVAGSFGAGGNGGAGALWNGSYYAGGGGGSSGNSSGAGGIGGGGNGTNFGSNTLAGNGTANTGGGAGGGEYGASGGSGVVIIRYRAD